MLISEQLFMCLFIKQKLWLIENKIIYRGSNVFMANTAHTEIPVFIRLEKDIG